MTVFLPESHLECVIAFGVLAMVSRRPGWVIPWIARASERRITLLTYSHPMLRPTLQRPSGLSDGTAQKGMSLEDALGEVRIHGPAGLLDKPENRPTNLQIPLVRKN